MIRYRIASDELESAVDAERPGWRRRAQRRTERFIAAGGYDEDSPIWSEIKPVYMRLQHNKCAYCERRLAAADFGGTIEHDVEHYRPKNGVPIWPGGETFHFETGDPLDDGYYWLAYDLFNYCAACKKCNSPLKSNYFPVARDRGAAADAVADLNETERPFLPYPLGEIDEDPERLIQFAGIAAIPAKRNGPRWRRAKVTIAFFKLNLREELLRGRAEALVALDNALAVIESNADDDRKQIARRDVQRMRGDATEFAACIRSACRMYIEDPMATREVFAAAREYLDSLD